jgi:catechol 2,3-dioxygenase-like lactoylglutathione lyase family enzyme
MTTKRKARALGVNHVALEVGDIEEALAFYGRLFEFALRGMAFQHPDSRGLADLAKYEGLHLTTSELR